MSFPVKSISRIARTLLGVATLVGLPSCSWMPGAREDKPTSMGVVSVRLKSPVPKKGRTFAQATETKGKTRKVLGFQSVSKDGDAAFVLPMGKVCAVDLFCDLNGNETPDPGEPLAQSGLTAPWPITATEDHILLLDFGAHRPLGLAASRSPVNETAQRQASNPKPLPSAVERHLEDLPPWMREALSR